MVENLKRLREPAALALLAVIVAFMALSVVRLVWVLTHGELPVFAAFADIANSMMNLTLVAALVALVCICLFVVPTTTRAVQVSWWSAFIVTLGTLLTILATGIGLWASNGALGVIFELLGGLLDIVLKVLATAVLWIIQRAARAGRLQAPEPIEVTVVEPQAPPVIPYDAPPVWEPNQASGSVWRTAAEAAAGTTPERPAAIAPREGAAKAFGWNRPDAAGGSTSGTPGPRDTP